MLLAIVSLLTSLLLSGLLSLLLLWCWYQWRHRELLRQAGKLPSISRRLPIIGSLYEVSGNLESEFFVNRFLRYCISYSLTVNASEDYFLRCM